MSDYAAGSFASHIVDIWNSATSGKTPPIFPSDPALLPVAYNSAVNVWNNSTTVAYNTSCWIAGASGLTGIGYLTDTPGVISGVPIGSTFASALTLISKRDVVGATHAIFPGHSLNTSVDTTGLSMYAAFVKSNGTIATRRIVRAYPIGKKAFDSNTINSIDISILTLESDVDSDIVPMRVLPANFEVYLSANPSYGFGYPTAYLTQDGIFCSSDIILFNPNSSYGTDLVASTRPSPDANRELWFQVIRAGDSSHPMCHLINIGGSNLELVFLTCAASGDGGTHISFIIDDVNAAMTANGSPYQIRATRSLSGDGQTVDLSGFIPLEAPMANKTVIVDGVGTGGRYSTLFSALQSECYGANPVTTNLTIYCNMYGDVGYRGHDAGKQSGHLLQTMSLASLTISSQAPWRAGFVPLLKGNGTGSALISANCIAMFDLGGTPQATSGIGTCTSLRIDGMQIGGAGSANDNGSITVLMGTGSSATVTCIPFFCNEDDSQWTGLGATGALNLYTYGGDITISDNVFILLQPQGDVATFILHQNQTGTTNANYLRNTLDGANTYAGGAGFGVWFDGSSGTLNVFCQLNLTISDTTNSGTAGGYSGFYFANGLTHVTLTGDHNVSSDGSAVGTSPLTGILDTDIFAQPPVGDFTLVTGVSVCSIASASVAPTDFYGYASVVYGKTDAGAINRPNVINLRVVDPSTITGLSTYGVASNASGTGITLHGTNVTNATYTAVAATGVVTFETATPMTVPIVGLTMDLPANKWQVDAWGDPSPALTGVAVAGYNPPGASIGVFMAPGLDPRMGDIGRRPRQLKRAEEYRTKNQ